MSTHLEPIRLPANQPPQFYRGGAAIAALRGQAESAADFLVQCITFFLS